MIKWTASWLRKKHWRDSPYSDAEFAEVTRQAERDAREFWFTILFALAVGVGSLLFILAGEWQRSRPKVRVRVVTQRIIWVHFHEDHFQLPGGAKNVP